MTETQNLVVEVETQQAINELARALAALRIRASIETCTTFGPLRKYTIKLDGLTDFSKVEKAGKNLKVQLGAFSTPLIYHISGTRSIGIDVMFGEHPIVDFAELAAKVDKSTLGLLSVLLGATEVAQPLVVDLAAMPHLLCAGTTGSGKSMCLHAIIESLTGGLGPRNCTLALIDPKQVEFTRYHHLDQLAYDVATSVDQAAEVMVDVRARMWRRLETLSKAGAKDIFEYRANGGKMKDLVVIIDEIAELMRAKKSKFQEAMLSVAEKGRAAGVHLVAATQHPSRDVITGPIKANFPSKIALQVSTGVHSKVILDATGAEHLNGRGDAFLTDNKHDLLRFQGAFVQLKEAKPLPKPKEKPVGFLGRLLNRGK